MFHMTLANQLRSGVLTLDATKNATKPVHHAFKTALGPVSTKVAAPCLALHLATAFHVLNAVPKISLAAISAANSTARLSRDRYSRPIRTRQSGLAGCNRLPSLHHVFCLNTCLVLQTALTCADRQGDPRDGEKLRREVCSRDKRTQPHRVGFRPIHLISFWVTWQNETSSGLRTQKSSLCFLSRAHAVRPRCGDKLT
jgi:hypothetical protein